MIEFFNNLSTLIFSLNSINSLTLTLEDKFIPYFLIFLSDLISFSYILLKVYRVLCISKITLDGLPTINPYKWPFSVFRIVTKPYFNFWSKTLPNLKLGKASFDISAILGLEVLTYLIFLCLQLKNIILSQAEKFLI